MLSLRFDQRGATYKKNGNNIFESFAYFYEALNTKAFGEYALLFGGQGKNTPMMYLPDFFFLSVSYLYAVLPLCNLLGSRLKMK